MIGMLSSLFIIIIISVHHLISTTSSFLQGDMRPNPRIEQELFHTEESQTAGINFDKVCGVS